MNWPDITIQICTYKRLKEIKLCISALIAHIQYAGHINWLVCDDCSGPHYLRKIKEVFPFVETLTTGVNSGWGINVNHGLGRIRDDIILFTEDDYILQSELNLNALVAALMVNENLGYFRLDGILGHRLVAHMKECDISAYLPNFRHSSGLGNLGKVHYWVLDSGSPELWLYSNRPHLKHRRFHKFYGLYPEKLRLGHTEESFAHTVKDRMHHRKAPVLAVPPELVVSRWDDIGVSYQHTEYDKVNEHVR